MIPDDRVGVVLQRPLLEERVAGDGEHRGAIAAERIGHDGLTRAGDGRRDHGAGLAQQIAAGA